MCLYSKSRNPSRSDSDIICYKVVKRTESGYYSYYQNSFLTKNLTDFVFTDSAPVIIEVYSDRRCITSGFIHSYKVYSYAMDLVKMSLVWKCIPEAEIWECMIPAGTDYYEGIHGDICSKKLIFKRKVC